MKHNIRNNFSSEILEIHLKNFSTLTTAKKGYTSETCVMPVSYLVHCGLVNIHGKLNKHINKKSTVLLKHLYFQRLPSE
jgi:hypothetical protein